MLINGDYLYFSKSNILLARNIFNNKEISTLIEGYIIGLVLDDGRLFVLLDGSTIIVLTLELKKISILQIETRMNVILPDSAINIKICGDHIYVFRVSGKIEVWNWRQIRLVSRISHKLNRLELYEVIDDKIYHADNGKFLHTYVKKKDKVRDTGAPPFDLVDMKRHGEYLIIYGRRILIIDNTAKDKIMHILQFGGDIMHVVCFDRYLFAIMTAAIRKIDIISGETLIEINIKEPMQYVIPGDGFILAKIRNEFKLMQLVEYGNADCEKCEESRWIFFGRNQHQSKCFMCEKKLIIDKQLINRLDVNLNTFDWNFE